MKRSDFFKLLGALPFVKLPELEEERLYSNAGGELVPLEAAKKDPDVCPACNGLGTVWSTHVQTARTEGYLPEHDGVFMATVACPECHPEQHEREVQQLRKGWP